MLETDPRKRLGCGLRPGAQELDALHSHPWFTGMDFDAIERKEVASGFIPDVSTACFTVDAKIQLARRPRRPRRTVPSRNRGW